MRIGRLAAAMWLTSGAAMCANQVHVVDGDGGVGVEFVSLQAAINAAANGDILLVRTCATPYAASTITGKGLTILGEKGPLGERPKGRSLLIQNTTAAQTTVVRGIEIDSLPQHFSQTYTVKSCAGAVLTEDCVIHQSDPTAVFSFMVYVEQSPAVVFTRCTIKAGTGIPLTGAVNAAVSAAGSSVSVYECTLTGSLGRDGQVISQPQGLTVGGAPGGVGLYVNASKAFVSGSTIVGGDGGDGVATTTCFAPGMGAAAVGGNGTLIGRDTTFTTGTNGAPAGICPPLAVFPPTFEPTVGVTLLAGDIDRSFEVSSPAPEGQVTTTTLTGVPGEFALLLVSFSANGVYTPGVGGALGGAAPYTAFPLGNLPPSGTLSFGVTIPVGGLPAGIDGVNLNEQAVVAGSSGFGLVSSPSVVTIVK